MTSRERVITSLNHKEPDKVPIDFGGMDSTGIMAIAYNALKRHLGLPESTTRIFDMQQQLAEPEREILDYFESDVVSLDNSFGETGEGWVEWELPDSSPSLVPSTAQPVKSESGWVLMDGERVKAEMPNGSFYFDSCNPPLTNAKSERDIQNHKWEYFTEEKLSELETKAKKLYEETEYAIIGGFGGSILEMGQTLRGWSQFMEDLISNTDFAETLMNKLADVHIKNLEMYLQAVGSYIQIIQMGDDLGMQSGPLLDPQLYYEIIQPKHKRIYQYVKKNSLLFLFMHSCGAIYDFIPSLIDAGVDILNPVQFTAADMEPEKLKNTFGGKITFWGGGVDTQKILPYGAPEEVAAQVRRQVQIFSKGGGFVFTPVHNIQANVPVENILAAYNTIKLIRDY